MKECLFSYGTLQKDDAQLKLFGRLLSGKRDVLIGYDLRSIEITDESFLSGGEQKQQLTLVSSVDKTVEGTVLEVTEDELLRADKYEPDGYERHKVELESGIQAWVYSVK